MALPLITKALGVAVPFIKKLVEWIAIALVVVGLVWAIYVTFIKPHTKPTPTTRQQADQIINYNYQNPRVAFGCMRFFPKEEKK